MQSRFRGTRRLALASCFLVLAACEENGNHGIIQPGDDVFGVWELDGSETFYLVIEEDLITTYDDRPAESCFAVSTVGILEREGEVFTLDVAGVQQIAHIRRDGDDGLVFELEGDESASYTWSNVVLTSLATC